jgi:hypothetical protein
MTVLLSDVIEQERSAPASSPWPVPDFEVQAGRYSALGEMPYLPFVLVILVGIIYWCIFPPSDELDFNFRIIIGFILSLMLSYYIGSSFLKFSRMKAEPLFCRCNPQGLLIGGLFITWDKIRILDVSDDGPVVGKGGSRRQLFSVTYETDANNAYPKFKNWKPYKKVRRKNLLTLCFIPPAFSGFSPYVIGETARFFKNIFDIRQAKSKCSVLMKRD